MLRRFFKAVLPTGTGYVPIILNNKTTKTLNDTYWFEYPKEEQELTEFIEAHKEEDVFFSPHFYNKPKTRRTPTHVNKNNVEKVAVVWCDGDKCPLENILVPPTTLVWTSDGKWHGYWRLGENYLPEEYEALSRSLYEVHKEEGMDAGWALSKRLRVPGTLNTKYDNVHYLVETEYIGNPKSITRQEFVKEYPPVVASGYADEAFALGEMPDLEPGFNTDKFVDSLNSYRITNAYFDTPKSDWSGQLYKLECLLFEKYIGLGTILAVCWEAQCNKYKRDGRDKRELWIQINRDFLRWKKYSGGDKDQYAQLEKELEGVDLPEIEADTGGISWKRIEFLSNEELITLENTAPTWIDRYVSWCMDKAPLSHENFHRLVACSILSSTLASHACYKLSFGTLHLNIYGFVLGSTTESRKSTTLNFGLKYIRAVAKYFDKRIINPTDVTPEALCADLAKFPYESSLYYSDEIQDLVESIKKKGSYLTGLLPILTKSYDGFIPGVLRRSNPNAVATDTPHFLTFLGLGIFDQTASNLTLSDIQTGFVPRCIVAVDNRDIATIGNDDVEVVADDFDNFDDLSDYVDTSFDKMFDTLSKYLIEVKKFWKGKQEGKRRKTQEPDGRILLGVDEDALERWKHFCRQADKLALAHRQKRDFLRPQFSRMEYTTLKVAGMLAMVRQSNKVNIVDMLKAIQMANSWAVDAENFVTAIANTDLGRHLQEIEDFVVGGGTQGRRLEAVLSRFRGQFKLYEIEDNIDYLMKAGSLQLRMIRGSKYLYSTIQEELQ